MSADRSGPFNRQGVPLTALPGRLHTLSHVDRPSCTPQARRGRGSRDVSRSFCTHLGLGLAPVIDRVPRPAARRTKISYARAAIKSVGGTGLSAAPAGSLCFRADAGSSWGRGCRVAIVGVAG
jgi:hypothetical protein